MVVFTIIYCNDGMLSPLLKYDRKGSKHWESQILLESSCYHLFSDHNQKKALTLDSIYWDRYSSVLVSWARLDYCIIQGCFFWGRHRQSLKVISSYLSSLFQQPKKEWFHFEYPFMDCVVFLLPSLGQHFLWYWSILWEGGLHLPFHSDPADPG